MSKKKTTVTLEQVKGGKQQEFDFAHALAILRFEEKSGRHDWKVQDKNWQYKENELIRSARLPKETEE